MALAIGFAAVPSAASAQFVLPDLCKTASPHKTLSYAGDEISATSAGGSYFYNPQGGCYRFIVDIGVGGNQKFTLHGDYADSASGPTTVSPAVQLPLSKPDCDNYSQHTAVYVKNILSTEFTRLASTWFDGVWRAASWVEPFGYQPAHCERVVTSGDAESTLSSHSTSFFGAKYRVVVGAKSTTWKQVKVTARPVPNPA